MAFIDDETSNDRNGIATIPAVVQRALGMHNLHHISATSSSTSGDHNYDDVVQGLEGFFLPYYLLLRSGQQHQHSNDVESALPKELMHAWEEMIRCQPDKMMTTKANAKGQSMSSSSMCRSSRPDGDTNSSANKKSRKRKRKSQHQIIALQHERSMGNSNGEMNTHTSASISGEEQNNNKRRRKKRRRRKCQANNAHDALNPSHITHGCNIREYSNYQILARIIIAPFTSSSLAAMKRCKQVEDNQQCHGTDTATSGKDDDDNDGGGDDAYTAKIALTHKMSKASTKNVYQTRSNATNTSTQLQRKKNPFLSIVSPRESLETIIDGVICTLVRRTHRFRFQSPSPPYANTRNTRLSTKTSIKTKTAQFSTVPEAASATAETFRRRFIHRRRVRKRKGADEESMITNISNATTTTVTTASRGDQKEAGTSPSVNNHWLLEENLFSTGYSLGSGDTTFAANRNDGTASSHVATNQQKHHLRGCPNMAPGIHCIHPNPLTSYGRSSSLMRFLHRVIGDEALREILVNCIVLIPAATTLSSVVSFHRGNYFQLCGPPITMLAKKFDGMSKSSTANPESRNRKRQRSSDAETSGKSECDMRCPTNGNDGVGIEKQLDPNKPVPRGNLFYCDFYNKHVGLPPRHLLNQQGEKSTDVSKPHAQTKPSSVDVELLNAMTQIWPVRKAGGNVVTVVSSKKRRCRWRRLRECGIAMCKDMRRRHQQCNYSRLLEHCCPLPAVDTTTTDSDGKTILSRYVTMHHTPVESVVLFLKAVLRCAFPSSFWGSLHNFNQAVQTIRVFSNLGRTEQLPEKAIVDGIRVLDMKWLLPNICKKDQPYHRPKLSLSAHKSATVLVRNVMRWLYCQFVIPILRSVFYITETEFTGSKVLYYRRPVWNRIKSLSMKALLQQQYREMSAVKVQKLLSNHNVGCPPAPLRILPKSTGIRAIAMLSKSCAIDRSSDNIFGAKSSKRFRRNGPAPNKILQPTFHALKYEHEKRPTLFGAGVLGLTEVFPSFCLFVEAVTKKESILNSTGNRLNSGRGRTPLYFASADIKHCYDTINQKRLYELLRSVVDEDVYLTKNNFILHCNNRNRSLRCRWKKRTFSPDQLSRFHDTTSNDCTDTFFDSIFVEGVHCSIEKKETTLGLLRDHIFGQVLVASVNHGQRYLLQHSGIPQGSILSSTLCNIYFANIEDTLLGGVFEEGSHIIRGCSSTTCDVVFVQNKCDVHLLVRIVDDFLLISSSKDTSIRFLKKLNEGIPSLGVKINSDKSRVNYPISLKNMNTSKLEVVETCHDFFPWCGLLIDTKTCEVSLDYKRFWGIHATDTVVIHRTGNEGLNLKKKMKDFVRPRCCQRLLFSSDVNRIDMIRLNFYQTFLLCAVKLVYYIRSGRGETSTQHQQFIYDSACDTIHFAFSLISSKIKHGDWRTFSSSTNRRSLNFQLSWNDALWLGKHAFRHVFRKRSETETQKMQMLCHLFSDSSRSLGMEPSGSERELLAVTRRALRQFPLKWV